MKCAPARGEIFAVRSFRLQSARYMTLHRSSLKPVSTRCYLLRLDILEEPPAGQELVRKTRSRSQAITCFLKATSGKDCWVCRTVNVHKDAAKRPQQRGPSPSLRSGC